MSREIPGGYAGKVLRVNLTDNSYFIEQKDNLFYRRHLGGSGFITHFLLKELKPGSEPLGPENKLIFALGPLTGTPIIGNGRHGVGAKSQLTGGIALSQVGGFWGAELKRAGFDAIIIEGKARHPVYLWIKDGEVSIRGAAHLWGKKTKETLEEIRSELGDNKVQVALIGPAGENKVSFACIMHGLFNAAGRGGLGAIMGAKNLKAVAVRGTNRPEVANSAWVNEANRKFRDSILFNHWLTRELREYGTLGPSMEAGEVTGDLPIRNFRDGIFPEVKKISGVAIKNTIRIGMDGCFSCPVRCKKRVKTDEPYHIDPDYGGPEYEALAALGSNLGVDELEVIAKANELCNAYSLDVISTGGVIAFAMECYERGYLTQNDTGGIELKFGNSEAVLTCIELIAHNQGFGRLLAMGTARLSEKIGCGSEAFAMEVKGLDAGMHEPRLTPCMGLGFMINPHGADHCCNVRDTNFEHGIALYNSVGFHEPIPMNEMNPRKLALFKFGHLRQVLFDCLLLCHFAAVALDFETMAEITAAVTGWNTGVVEQLRVAERTLTTARLFNIREGFTANDDRLPERFFQPRTDGALSKHGLDREKMEKAKLYYYTLMGWDENGVPLPEKVEELCIE